MSEQSVGRRLVLLPLLLLLCPFIQAFVPSRRRSTRPLQYNIFVGAPRVGWTEAHQKPSFLLARKDSFEDSDIVDGFDDDGKEDGDSESGGLDDDDIVLEEDAEDDVEIDDLEDAIEEIVFEDEEDEDEEDEDEEDEDEEDEDDEIEEELLEVVEESSVVMTADDNIEWNFEEDGAVYELEDDPDDENYTKQKELAEQAIQSSKTRTEEDNFDPEKFLNDNPDFRVEDLPFFQELQDKSKDVLLVEDDVKDFNLDDLDKVPDFTVSDEYPRHDPDEENVLEKITGVTDDTMVELDNAYKTLRNTVEETPWDKIMLRSLEGFDGLSNQTMNEMEECLEEIGGASYNVTNWLLYDLDFNVSNLILAAVKHNRDAPVLLQHWYPQLLTYERYEHARERNFDFNWDDVEQADISELERYYAGFGYTEIPKKAPAETGIINLDYLDEEEIKMAAFENWMIEVYNEEDDKVDFDDDKIRDEDNVFSEFYEEKWHPDLPTFEDAEDDIEEWENQIGDDEDVRDYRDRWGKMYEYDVVHDEEFGREFRGHLIIACTDQDEDLEIAEKITLRFEKEFGKQVYVETRVMALALPDDNVFEVWLESYEIDLLHSKKRASTKSQGWTGPAEVDDAQIDYLTERVGFLISDDARYSYRMMEAAQ